MEVAEYERMYRLEDRYWWYRALRAVLTQAWRRHGLTSGVRILDAGCGTGANLALLRSLGITVGIDMAAEALRWATTRPGARIAQASVGELPFADATFDAVVSCDVLCHRSLPDKRAAVAELGRVLRPGGRLFLNLPAYQWLFSSHDVAVFNDRRFTRAQVCQLLRDAGLQPIYVTHWNTLLFPAILLVRLVRRYTAQDRSDLADAGHPLGNTLFGALLAVERLLNRVAPLPFGLSIFAVAQRNG